MGPAFRVQKYYFSSYQNAVTRQPVLQAHTSLLYMYVLNGLNAVD